MVEHKDDMSVEDVDRAVASDIKHLKRSTNVYTTLGALVIILFGVVLGYKFYVKLGGSNQNLLGAAADFITVGYVSSDDARILADPRKDAAVVKNLSAGDSVFILQKEGEWRRVHKENPGGEPWVGWTNSSWIQTKEEIRAAVEELADSPIEILQPVQWIVDEVGNFTILGQVRNKSDIPVRNVRVGIEYYDIEGKRIDKQIVVVNPDKPLVAGAPQSFFVTGKQRPNYNFVKYSLEGFD